MAQRQVQPPGDRRLDRGQQGQQGQRIQQAGRVQPPPAPLQRAQPQQAQRAAPAQQPRMQQPVPQPRPGDVTVAGMTLPGWVILPLRLFLGFSFLAAGWDKLTDPTYLDPASRDYIGQQISRMAQGSPIGGFLLNVAAPNAGLFGVMVMGGELCIGIAVLLGVLTRFSAIMGLLLNLTFFLSATWEVHPFYFGADLPYVFGWLTLILAGPGPLALDWAIRRWLTETSAPIVTSSGRVIQPPMEPGQELTRRAFLGGGAAVLAGLVLAGTGIAWGIAHQAGSRTGALTTPQPQANGAGSGGTSSTAPSTATAVPEAAATNTPAPAQGGGGPGAAPTQPSAQPTDTAAPSGPQGQLIAQAGSVPAGQASEFTLPSGDPAVLVHNDSGYSAYVAICTHQGCQVQPIGQGYLGCPCHGAIFDTSQQAQPVRGPARRPLSPVAITTDAKGNVYLAQQ